MADKKHRMVCYFFELIYGLVLNKYDNVSSNPGFESYLLEWSGGYGNAGDDDDVEMTDASVDVDVPVVVFLDG